MTARIFAPADPEISATRRAIARVQYQDDAFPVETPAGQLWERVRDHHSFLAVVLTDAQWARMCAVRNTLGTHSGRPFVRGPLAQHKAHGMAPWIDRQASGIIRAGERVK